MAHWSGKYLNQPYVPELHDCAVFAAAVQAAEFGRHVVLPADRGGTARARSAQISARMADYLVRTDAPADGDIVMTQAAGNWHIGVLAELSGEHWMIHASGKAGCVIATRISDLQRTGLMLEGFYKCNNPT